MTEIVTEQPRGLGLADRSRFPFVGIGLLSGLINMSGGGTIVYVADASLGPSESEYPRVCRSHQPGCRAVRVSRETSAARSGFRREELHLRKRVGTSQSGRRACGGSSAPPTCLRGSRRIQRPY